MQLQQLWLLGFLLQVPGGYFSCQSRGGYNPGTDSRQACGPECSFQGLQQTSVIYRVKNWNLVHLMLNQTSHREIEHSKWCSSLT
ncbi:uncharacterized protein LOC113132448 isoform X3 [Mastacembelus armatus]|uniref:uncharacterized protein LOC113132448 isoform X3 n=1 Tax=Mastacembelus armatus TaxID=205130 RepID=UPI000E457AC6|nr:uncharacterized protein LOC113132448 isoform X3 [Mastacembelus armatus]